MTNEVEKTNNETTRNFLSIKKMVRDIYNKSMDPNYIPKRETLHGAGNLGSLAGGRSPTNARR